VTDVLWFLGSTLRGRADPYIDVAGFDDPGVRRCTRGGVTELFPEKLHRIIRDAEANGRDDVVSFLPHGRAFRVHDMHRFSDEFLAGYFSDDYRWSSFTRQLQLYGFIRILSGRDTDAYYHEVNGSDPS